ncbi:MAG: transcriptional regulator NrdR [Anaerolineae bacterium]|nr:transcriptional regulator NrdR [Anaerolineae bacterium]
MQCPNCGEPNTQVVDTRMITNGVRRRRQCPKCGQRFTTYEYPASTTPLVVKNDGRREEFDRNKLLAGIRKACAKRPVSAEQIDAIVASVESQIHNSRAKEISSEKIGQMVLEQLRQIDKVAYIRFASVYLRMDDLEALKQEVEKLLKSGDQGSTTRP